MHEGATIQHERPCDSRHTLRQLHIITLHHRRGWKFEGLILYTGRPRKVMPQTWNEQIFGSLPEAHCATSIKCYAVGRLYGSAYDRPPAHLPSLLQRHAWIADSRLWTNMEMEGPVLLSVIAPLVILIPMLADRPPKQANHSWCAKVVMWRIKSQRHRRHQIQRN